MDLLIVDDQPEIREGIGTTIPWERHGIRVCGTARDGSEALAILEQFEPEIVIADIQMPTVDGLELLEIVNDRYPMTRVILISGFDEFTYAQRAVELHAFAYLLKPVDEGELVSKVRAARHEIEELSLRLREDAELRRKVDASVPLLRDNFISRLAAGVLDPVSPDVRDRAASLGIPVDSGEYQVALFEPSRTSGGSLSTVHDQDLARVAVARSAPGFFTAPLGVTSFTFSDYPGALISAPALERDVVPERCRKIRRWANEELGLSLSVGIGPPARDFSGIWPTVRMAANALEYRLVVGRNEIVEFAAVQPSYRSTAAIEAYRRELSTVSARVLWALQSGAEELLAEAEESVTGGLLEAVSDDPSTADTAVYLLSFQLAQLRIPLQLDFEPMGVVDLINRLRGLRDRGRIRRVIHEYLSSLIDAGEENSKSRNTFTVEKAIGFIREHIHDDVSLSTVARSLLIHPNYLSRLFRQVVGKSFIEYVTAVKMEEAQRLLKQSTDRIYEIARSIGYRDVDHFTRLFKRTVGVSPSQYRELG